MYVGIVTLLCEKKFPKKRCTSVDRFWVLIRDHVIQGVLQRGRGGANRHKITKLLKHAAEKSNEPNLDRCINVAEARRAMEQWKQSLKLLNVAMHLHEK